MTAQKTLTAKNFREDSMKLYLYSMGPDLWQLRKSNGSAESGTLKTLQMIGLMAAFYRKNSFCFDAHDKGRSLFEAIDKVLDYKPAPIDPRPVHIPPPSQIINGRSVD
jgi:hypothetical protein